MKCKYKVVRYVADEGPVSVDRDGHYNMRTPEKELERILIENEGWLFCAAVPAFGKYVTHLVFVKGSEDD